MSNLECTEIYPNVYVYKNLLENIDDLYAIMKESELSSEGKYFLKPWDKWSQFGTYTQIKNEAESDEQTKATEMYIKEKSFADQVQKAYDLALADYVEKTKVVVSGSDKQRVHLISAQIRDLKKPEPYKGKGILYVGETLRRKKGKKK